jgi:hypothetical protein
MNQDYPTNQVVEFPSLHILIMEVSSGSQRPMIDKFSPLSIPREKPGKHRGEN